MQRSTLAGLGALLVVGIALAVHFGKSKAPPEPVSQAPKPAISASAAAEPIAATEPAPPPLPSGAPVLPADAPKRVKFGVVLLTYRGAEAAPSDARPKPEALAKAKALLEEARRDFAEAVKKGDRGSTADAGTMPRGVLDPNLEFTIFTLKKGEVAEPVDTPRGYWLVRRNE
jgi:hypothetical protein